MGRTAPPCQAGKVAWARLSAYIPATFRSSPMIWCFARRAGEALRSERERSTPAPRVRPLWPHPRRAPQGRGWPEPTCWRAIRFCSDRCRDRVPWPVPCVRQQAGWPPEISPQAPSKVELISATRRTAERRKGWKCLTAWGWLRRSISVGAGARTSPPGIRGPVAVQPDRRRRNPQPRNCPEIGVRSPFWLPQGSAAARTSPTP